MGCLTKAHIQCQVPVFPTLLLQWQIHSSSRFRLHWNTTAVPLALFAQQWYWWNVSATTPWRRRRSHNGLPDLSRYTAYHESNTWSIQNLAGKEPRSFSTVLDISKFRDLIEIVWNTVIRLKFHEQEPWCVWQTSDVTEECNTAKGHSPDFSCMVPFSQTPGHVLPHKLYHRFCNVHIHPSLANSTV